jgi:hypothetical protein
MIYNTKIENNQLQIKIIDNNNAHSMTIKLIVNTDCLDYKLVDEFDKEHLIYLFPYLLIINKIYK